MGAPNNGAEFGGGSRRAGDEVKEAPPRIEAKDQFELEGAEDTEIKEEGGDKTAQPIPARPISPADHRGDPERLKDVSEIMRDLTSANLSDLRITNIALDLNGTQKLKITFGNTGRPEKKGRVLTLYTRDGTWAYEA